MADTLQVPGPPSESGWLVLLGGGEFSFGDTEQFDRFILSKMPAGNRHIAFLPTASGSTEYGRHLGHYFRGLDPTVELETVPVYRPRDARRGRNVERVRRAGLVYLGGGVTNTLLSTIRATPVEEAIRDVQARGGVVAAIGAAASAAGSVARSMVTVAAPIDGLGWIPETLIETGIEGVDDRRFRLLMSTPGLRLGIGIPAGNALAIGPDRNCLVLGDDTIVVLRKQ